MKAYQCDVCRDCKKVFTAFVKGQRERKEKERRKNERNHTER